MYVNRIETLVWKEFFAIADLRSLYFACSMKKKEH